LIDAVMEERALREKLQKDKASLQDLVRSGACDADAVMTMRMYFDVQQALQALKRQRESEAHPSRAWRRRYCCKGIDEREDRL
jgi:hypothetical protein